MALELLEGTTAAIDLTVEFGGTPASLKAAFNYISARMQRGFFDQTTFASDGWVSETCGMRQCLIHADGYASKGTPFSDPLELFSDNVPRAVVFTADTGCTITGDYLAASDGIGMRAAANSDRGIDLRSRGAVTSAWVVA
jgi:hypothetical protein